MCSDLSPLAAEGLGDVDRLQDFLTADLRVVLMGERFSADWEEEDKEEVEEEEEGSPEASVQNKTKQTDSIVFSGPAAFRAAVLQSDALSLLVWYE